MKVQVDIPDWLWGRLASIADERDIPVAGVIADALREVIDQAGNPHRRLSRLELLEEELAAARQSGWYAPRGGYANAG